MRSQRSAADSEAQHSRAVALRPDRPLIIMTLLPSPSLLSCCHQTENTDEKKTQTSELDRRKKEKRGKIHKGVKSIHVDVNVHTNLLPHRLCAHVRQDGWKTDENLNNNLFVFYEPDQTERKQYFILKFKFTKWLP